MIEKEEIKKLIYDKAVIYYYDERVCQNKISQIKLDKIHYVVNTNSLDYVLDKNNIFCFKFENLFKKQKEADFYSKYQNKTRIETLNLPFYGDIVPYKTYNFYDKDMNEWVIYHSLNNKLVLELLNEQKKLGSKPPVIYDNMEEDYIKICDYAIKLFYGQINAIDLYFTF